MLPPGHIAGAYLLTSAVLTLTYPPVSPEQMGILLAVGTFFGFAPDLDLFYGFAKNKTMTASDDTFDHRTFLSHAPIFWLIPGVVLFFFMPDPFWKEVGLLSWLGSWSHFLLDSIEGGVMWLWPWRKKRYALLPEGKGYVNSEKRFFPFWIGFFRWYIKTFVSIWVELGLIITAVFFVFR